MSPMMSRDNRWQTRIVGREDVSPADIIPNKHNWRRHPDRQREALEGVLDNIGWVQDVIINKRTGHLIDGHLRVELAAARKESSIPVVYVDLSEQEEDIILSSLDPLTSMATADEEQLNKLLGEIGESPILDEIYGDSETKPEGLEIIDEDLKPISMLRILISVPVDRAIQVRQIIEQLGDLDGVEVDYGGNN